MRLKRWQQVRVGGMEEQCHDLARGFGIHLDGDVEARALLLSAHGGMG